MMTKEQILQHLHDDREQRLEDGWTREEFQEMMGYKLTRAKVVIQEGVKTGKFVTAGLRRSQMMDGRVTWLPIYQFRNVQKARPTQKCNHRAKVGAISGIRIVSSRRNGRD